ncbi:MAG: S41 family peptidase [Phycisphaerae bacterium]|nr:S41 family peptidase [Phycisphaerae bacterium]
MKRLLKTSIVSWCLFAAGPAVMVSPPASSADTLEENKPVGSAVQQEKWLEGLSLVGTGKIDQATEIINSLATAGVSDERVAHVHSWLSEYGEFEESRRERLGKDYNKYVSWAKDDIAAGRRHQALVSISMAHSVADDPDEFVKEPWVVEAVENALQAAQDYEAKNKWYAAARVYVRLQDLYPLDKEYRKALERCQDHIRLELTYEPEADWESAVADISKDMAYDAFLKISTDYLKTPDFREAVLGALRQVLLMTRSPKLAEVFEKLNDKEAVAEFSTRVEARLKFAEAKESLTVHELIAHFERVLEINEEIGLFPQTVLVREFTYGALQPLDRFSDMIWPSDVLEFNKHTQGRFSGVGIQIRKNDGEPILVVSPLKDSPAYRAGVRPGDLITKINGKNAAKYTITKAVREITGPVGTTVNLTLKRPGEEEEFELKLERQEISVESIKGFDRDDHDAWKYMIDDKHKIACIRLTNFTESSADELKEVLAGLTKQGLRGLVFDLRDNPGGPLKAAVDVSGMFLPANKPIVSTKDRNGSPWEVSSPSDTSYTDFPMIILTSRYSASASEIVTGALQVHKRALVLGERTYGKGSVQQVLPLNRSRMAFLKLTTQLYYLPDGRCLHKDDDSVTWGVDADIPARVFPKERIKLYDLQLKRDILKGKNQDKLSDDDIQRVTSYRSTSQPGKGESEKGTPSSATSKPAAGLDTVEGDETEGDEEDDEDFVTREDPNDYPESDPQLDLAILLMRIRLESNEPWPSRATQMAATPAPVKAQP